MPFAPNIVFRMRWMIGIALLAIAAIVPVALSRARRCAARHGAPLLSPPQPLPSLNAGAGRPGRAHAGQARRGDRPARRRARRAPPPRRSSASSAAGHRATCTSSTRSPPSCPPPAPASSPRGPSVRAVSLNGAVKPQATRRRPLDQLTTVDPDAVPLEHATAAPAAASASRSIDTGIAGDLPDFRISDADKRSRVIGSAVVNPDATTADRHATATARTSPGIIAGNSRQPRRRRPATRAATSGVAPRREPRLDQGLRRRRQRDRPRRDRRHPVRRRPQGGLQHPRHQPVARVDGRRVLQDRPARRRRRGSLVQRHLRRRRRRQPRPRRRRRSATRPATTPTSSPSARSTTRAPRRSPTTSRPAGRAAARRRTASRSPTSTRRAPRSSRRSRRTASTPSCARVVRQRGGEYIRAGGTSMAAPMVAGAAAIGFQLGPRCTPNRIKALLSDSDRPLTDTIDELSLVDAARRFATDGGRLANQGLSPNDYIDPATGEIDYTRSSWSRSSWSDAARPAAVELEPLELEHGSGRDPADSAAVDPRARAGAAPAGALELVDQLDQVTLARGPERTARPGIAWARRDSARLVPPHRRRPAVRRPAPGPRHALRGLLLAPHRRAPRAASRSCCAASAATPRAVGDRRARRPPGGPRPLARSSRWPRCSFARARRRAGGVLRGLGRRAARRPRRRTRGSTCASRRAADGRGAPSAGSARRRSCPGCRSTGTRTCSARASRGGLGVGRRVRRHCYAEKNWGPALHRALVVGPGPGLPGRRRLRRLRGRRAVLGGAPTVGRRARSRTGCCGSRRRSRA